jgi:hypothetical protein
MELLLSQDRVVNLLYEHTFPRTPAPQSEWQGELLAQETPTDTPRTASLHADSPRSATRPAQASVAQQQAEPASVSSVG